MILAKLVCYTGFWR